eukprot:742624-Alexandrium_andersonii.AAC.1
MCIRDSTQPETQWVPIDRNCRAGAARNSCTSYSPHGPGPFQPAGIECKTGCTDFVPPRTPAAKPAQ